MHTDHETNSINDKGWVLLFHVTEAFVSLKILTNGGLISLSFIRTHESDEFIRIQFPMTQTIDLL